MGFALTASFFEFNLFCSSNANEEKVLKSLVVGSASISISDSISDRAIALLVMLRG